MNGDATFGRPGMPPLEFYHTVGVPSATTDTLYHPVEVKKGRWTCDCDFGKHHPFCKCRHAMQVEGARKDMEIEFLKELHELPDDAWETLENVVSHFTGKHGVAMDFIAVRILKLAVAKGVMTADDLYVDMGEKTMAHHNIIGTTFRYLQAKTFIRKVGIHGSRKPNNHGSAAFDWSITDEGRNALTQPYVVDEAPASMADSD